MSFSSHKLSGALMVAAVLLAACETTDDRRTHRENPPVATPTTSETSYAGLSRLSLCPMSSVTNAPDTVDGLAVRDFAPVVDVKDVYLAVAPVETACLSSGFGPRGSRLHKGIDLHNATAVNVFAAAGARVKEARYRDDYGNMVVLDHGNGVFTRYAHLESIESGVEPGAFVTAGKTIGVMGSSASRRIPRHLHYEVLTGEWGALSGSFGLQPVDIFARLAAN